MRTARQQDDRRMTGEYTFFDPNESPPDLHEQTEYFLLTVERFRAMNNAERNTTSTANSSNPNMNINVNMNSHSALKMEPPTIYPLLVGDDNQYDLATFDESSGHGVELERQHLMDNTINKFYGSIPPKSEACDDNNSGNDQMEISPINSPRPLSPSTSKAFLTSFFSSHLPPPVTSSLSSSSSSSMTTSPPQLPQTAQPTNVVVKSEKDECTACHHRPQKAKRRTIATSATDETYQCDQCEKSFLYKRGLKRHVIVVHNGGYDIAERSCFVCRRIFTQKSSLLRHFSTQTHLRQLFSEMQDYNSDMNADEFKDDETRKFDRNRLLDAWRAMKS